MFVLRREQEGRQTTAGNLFAASTAVSHIDVLQLVDSGFVTLEQTNVILSLQKDIGASTVISLTKKGRKCFSKAK